MWVPVREIVKRQKEKKEPMRRSVAKLQTPNSKFEVLPKIKLRQNARAPIIWFQKFLLVPGKN